MEAQRHMMMEQQEGHHGEPGSAAPAKTQVQLALEALQKAVADESRSSPSGASPPMAAPAGSATKCDSAFLDGLYLNLNHSLCESSKSAACGHTDFSRYLMPLQTAIMMVGGEITMMLTMGGGHAGMASFKDAVRGQGRLQRGVEQLPDEHAGLRAAFEEIMQAESKRELLSCAANFTALAHGTPLEKEAGRAGDRIASLLKRTKISWGARGAILSTSVAVPFFNSYPAAQAAGPSVSDCLQSLPENEYFSAEKVARDQETYKFMHFEKMGPACTPSYRLSPEVLAFLQLPYRRQRELLERSPGLCGYYSQFNERIVKGMQPPGEIEAVKFQASDKLAEFSLADGEHSSAFRFDYDPQTKDTTRLTVTSVAPPGKVTYLFEGYGAKFLSRVEITEAGSRTLVRTPEELRRAESSGDRQAKSVIALFRAYRYFRPVITECIATAHVENCAQAANGLRARLDR